MGAVKVWVSREDDNPIIKATVKRATETCNMFCNIAGKRVKSYVTRFTTHESNLSGNKQGCCKLREYSLGLNYAGVTPYTDTRFALFFLNQLFATSNKYRF